MVGWLMLQLLGFAAAGEEAGGVVAWMAHLGGFLAGAVTMGCLQNHTKRRLVRDRHGELCFRPNAEPDEVLPEQTEIAPAPTNCPFCDGPLSEADQLAANLLRCPHPDCGHCIYLEEQVVASAVP